MEAADFIKTLTSLADLTPGLLHELATSLRSEIYKPHQVIQAAGNPDTRLFFVDSGFVRAYFYDDAGNDQTVKFSGPGQVIFSVQGYYRTACFYYLEIMEPTQLLTLSYERLATLGKDFAEVSGLIRYFLLKDQQAEFDRQLLLAMPPEERYRFLRKNHNHLFSRVSARIIASYLHLSRETLSRYMAKR